MKQKGPQMDVSVIIVNYNTRALTLDCIHSVIEKTSGVLYEIIVVDNASSDDSVVALKSTFPDVIVIESNINLGFGKANNLGAGYATGTYLFFLNTDTLLVNNAIHCLTSFMEDANNAGVGVCGGNLYRLDNQPNFSYSMYFPSLVSIACYRSRVPFLPKIKDTFNTTGENKAVAVIIGADLFMRKKLFDELHGFDPLFFMYVEDAELMYRVHRLNYRIVSVPGAKIIHLQGESSTIGAKLIMEVRGYLIFFRKHSNALTIAFYKIMELFFASLRLVAYFFTFNFQRCRDYLGLIRFILHPGNKGKI